MDRPKMTSPKKLLEKKTGIMGVDMSGQVMKGKRIIKRKEMKKSAMGYK